MNIIEKVKDLCVFHATIIELGDDNYYMDWIAHSCGLPDEPMLSTLCEIDEKQYLDISNYFIGMLTEYADEKGAHNEMKKIMKNGKLEGMLFYNALIYQMLEDMSV